MTEEAAALRRAYMREYRQRPGYKERNKQAVQKYWERKAEAMRKERDENAKAEAD